MPEATATQVMNKRKRGAADEPSGRPAPGFKDGEVAQFGVENSAMDQLTAFNSNQDPQQNGGTPSGATADTAAAALHYPIAGDASFPAQGSSGEYPDAGYGMDTLKESPTQAQGSQHSPGGGATPSKPAVGSEEWHKIRKDNHKEGKLLTRDLHAESTNVISQSSEDEEKPLTKASMSSQRLSQAARRTRALSFSAQSSTSASSRTPRRPTSRSGHWRSCYLIKQSTSSARHATGSKPITRKLGTRKKHTREPVKRTTSKSNSRLAKRALLQLRKARRSGI